MWSTALSIFRFSTVNVWYSKMIVSYSRTSQLCLHSSSFDSGTNISRFLCCEFSFNNAYQAEGFEIIVWNVFSKISLTSFRAFFSTTLLFAQLFGFSFIWVFLFYSFQNYRLVWPRKTVCSKQKQKRSKHHTPCPGWKMWTQMQGGSFFLVLEI